MIPVVVPVVRFSGWAAGGLDMEMGSGSAVVEVEEEGGGGLWW